MTGKNGYTPTQLRMLAVLADGMPHTRKELHACLEDELQPLSHVQVHVSGIRKYLRCKGEDIVCIIANGPISYRHVRLLASAYDGYS